jgi:hypothetical protein
VTGPGVPEAPAAVTAAGLLPRIGAGLVAAAPGGWRELRLELDAAGPLTRATFAVVTADGAVASEPVPAEVFAHTDAFRAATAGPGTGAWFRCRVTVVPGPDVAADLDYDTEPRFDVPPAPETWVEELRLHPRDAAHIPPWLRHHL